MNNRSLMPVVVIVVGLALCVWLSNDLYKQKVNIATYEQNGPTLFYAGFDKFLSNVSWMALVQWRADGARMTADRAESLYRKLDSLTNLDPLFADAYLDGALSLAPVKPDRALMLLDKAMAMGLGDNWKVPFYAGTVCMQYNNDPAKAEEYFAKAVVLPDRPDYVHSALLHAKTRQVENEPLRAMAIWYDDFKQASDKTERGVAASQIRDRGQSYLEDLDAKTKAATDPAEREQLAAQRKQAQQMLTDVGTAGETAPDTTVAADASPTTAPADANTPAPAK